MATRHAGCLEVGEAESEQPRTLPAFLLEQVLRLALGDCLQQLLAVAPVSRQWRAAALQAARSAPLHGPASFPLLEQCPSLRALQLAVQADTPALLRALARPQGPPTADAIHKPGSGCGGGGGASSVGARQHQRAQPARLPLPHLARVSLRAAAEGQPAAGAAAALRALGELEAAYGAAGRRLELEVDIWAGPALAPCAGPSLVQAAQQPGAALGPAPPPPGGDGGGGGGGGANGGAVAPVDTNVAAALAALRGLSAVALSGPHAADVLGGMTAAPPPAERPPAADAASQPPPPQAAAAAASPAGVTRLSLSGVTRAASLLSVARLPRLMDLLLTFDAPGVGGGWVAPLLCIGRGVTRLALSSPAHPFQGVKLQGVITVAASLPNLRSLDLDGCQLVAARPGDGAPLRCDLRPLAALAGLTALRFAGGSASVQRHATMREILSPVAAAGALPRLATVKLNLAGRRWRFGRDWALTADEFRRWVADPGCPLQPPIEPA